MQFSLVAVTLFGTYASPSEGGSSAAITIESVRVLGVFPTIMNVPSA